MDMETLLLIICVCCSVYCLISATYIIIKNRIAKKINKNQNESNRITTPKINENLTEYFNCVGETVVNPDGTDRQKLIKKITNNYKKTELETHELFGGYSNKELLESYNECVSEFENINFTGTFEKSEFNGKPAYIILLDDIDDKQYAIANMAKKDIEKFENIINNHQIISTSISVTGGKIKKVGFSDDYEETPIIETDELYYGVIFKIVYTELPKEGSIQ